MDKMETVGIKALRDALSGYLRKVALGVRVLVSDRGKVIAEIVSPGSRLPDHLPGSYSPQVHEWIERGHLSIGKKRRTQVKKSGVVGKGSLQDLLDAERGD